MALNCYLPASPLRAVADGRAVFFAHFWHAYPISSWPHEHIDMGLYRGPIAVDEQAVSEARGAPACCILALSLSFRILLLLRCVVFADAPTLLHTWLLFSYPSSYQYLTN